MIVSLSALALQTLERQAQVNTGDAIFPGRGGGPTSKSALAEVPIRDLGVDPGSPHSWRSVFREARGDVCASIAISPRRR
jgi:hypothetical protein